jgi:hypothetical protein
LSGVRVKKEGIAAKNAKDAKITTYIRYVIDRSLPAYNYAI